MATDRQKYNFLAAWVKQLDNALDEGDDLAAQACEVMGLDKMARTIGELNERIERCEQWLAQLESEMEELDDDGRPSLGEEPDSDDDGDDDDELDGVEPPVGGLRQPDRRVAAPVGGASRPEVSRRSGRVKGAPRVLVPRGAK